MAERRVAGARFVSSDEAKTAKGKITANSSESQVVAAANNSRSVLILVNDGANKAWIAYGPTATAEEGLPLYPEGGSHVVDNYTGAVSVRTASGESLVGFVEV